MKGICFRTRGGTKPAKTPMEANAKLTSVAYDKHFTINCDDKKVSGVSSFCRLIGKLLYLTVIRPDIAFIVQDLSQFLQSPKQLHFSVALRIVKYVKNQPGLGMLFLDENGQHLASYCDSHWAGCCETRKSVIGYCVKFGMSLISWKEQKQGTISRSSVKAKYRNIGITVAELVWIKGLLEEMNVQHK